eukprot:Tamp_09862.p2 GENE.Tamp_09862~~Tamp_09862.p2  ORF type:complete len:236 (-),score=38.16 Tamp_09862:322-1029(-)
MTPGATAAGDADSSSLDPSGGDATRGVSHRRPSKRKRGCRGGRKTTERPCERQDASSSVTAASYSSSLVLRLQALESSEVECRNTCICAYCDLSAELHFQAWTLHSPTHPAAHTHTHLPLLLGQEAGEEEQERREAGLAGGRGGGGAGAPDTETTAATRMEQDNDAMMHHMEEEEDSLEPATNIDGEDMHDHHPEVAAMQERLSQAEQALEATAPLEGAAPGGLAGRGRPRRRGP